MATKQRTHWVYYFGRVVIRILVFFLATWKVKGKQNLPKKGPLLIVCNHLHIADPPIIAASIPRKSFFMAKEDLWDTKWTAFWVENFGAFPVRRDIFDREVIRQAEDKLKQGYAVIIFPEGARSKNARLKKGLPGAALIAMRLDVPILPMGITGSEKFNDLRWCFFHHPTVTVTFGQPFKLPPAEKGMSTRQKRQEMTDYIMGKIAELLPPEYRGYYADEKTGNN